MTRLPCCATWDDCEVIDTALDMRAVLDGHPVATGHALVYPRRHVDRLIGLTGAELHALRHLIGVIQAKSDAEDFTVAVNDGPHAGRTVPHLHVHVIPRRAGDVPDPRGGVRGLFVAPAHDPWLNREGA